MIFSARSKRNNPGLFWSRHLLAILTTGAGIWTAGIFIYPLALHANVIPAPAVASRFMYSLVCHQMPERSLSLYGIPLSVCSRCTSIYVTFTVFMFAAMMRGARPFAPRLAWIGAALIIPMLADAGMDGLGLLHASMASRIVTGTLAGAGFALFLAPNLVEYRLSAILSIHSPRIGGESHD